MTAHLVTDLVLVLSLLATLRLLGSGRLGISIQTVAAQGVLLGLLPAAISGGKWDVHAILIPAAVFMIKGFAFPYFLYRAVRETGTQKEKTPLVGFAASLFFGALALGAAIYFGKKLPFPTREVSGLLIPVALFTIMSGLFLIITRRIALSQVIGYLVLENGIFTFGMSIVSEAPVLVEMGILLDVFVAVFIMGITMFHISREFDHLDTEQLTALRD